MNQPSVAEEEVKTAHTTTKILRQPGCKLKLEIKVSPEAAKAAYQKAIKNISKEISVPGFRKGKAPEALILKQYGKHVTREWHDTIANTAFSEFLEQSKLYPFTRDKSVKRVDVKNATLENGAELVIEYESAPLIPKVDKSQIHIHAVPKRTITDKEVDERIHGIQLHHADWSLVTDRSIQEGDFVDLDILNIDSHPPHPICEDMRFEVAPGKMGRWMFNLLVGRNVGDTVEGVSEKEDNDVTDFKPTHCKITVKAVYTSTLPTLDDTFAQKLGVKDLNDLRPRIEEDLNNRANAELLDQKRAQVEEQLLSLYQFELPSSMIQEQKRQMIAERLARLQGNERPIEELKQEVEKEVTDELTRAYRLFFICRAVADEQGIDVQQHELADEMGRQMMMAPDQAMLFSKMGTEEMRSKLYVNVLSRKALDFLAS